MAADQPVKRLVPGFYRTNAWPFYFMVNQPPGSAPTLWGFSIWKNQPGYRTYGNDVAKWRKDYPLAKVWHDHDRVTDRAFIKAYRAEQKAQKEADRG